MTGSIRTSRAGLEFIMSFEGYRERAARLPDGRWTVGYGHVRSAREGVRVSPEDAGALLIYDVKRIEDVIGEWILAPLDQNQHDAIVSLVYNISPGHFRDSEVLRRLNAGDILGAAAAFDGWRKARVDGRLTVVDALVRRRAAEKALFLEPASGRRPAPTPLITPILDLAAPGASEVSAPEDAVKELSDAIDALAAGAVAPVITVPPAAPATPTPTPAPEAEPASVAVAPEPVVPSRADRPEPAPRSHDQVVADLKSRINKVLEREEALVAARKAAEATAARPAGRKSGGSKTKAAPVAPPPAVSAPAAKPAPAVPQATPAPAPPSAEPEVGNLRDAFGLSDLFRRDEESVPALDEAIQAPKPGSASIDDTEILPLPPEKDWSLDDRESRRQPGGASVWILVTIAAVALIAWGGWDFWKTAHASAAVTRDAMAIGPLAVMSGVVLLIMGLYFLASRRSRSAD